MPRGPRLDGPDTRDHVMVIGIEGRAIVRDAQDRGTSIVVKAEPYRLELVGESAPCGLSGARRDRRVSAGKK